MTSGTTTIEVRRLSPTASTIAIQGDITSATEGALMDAYGRASDGGDALDRARLQRP